MIYLLRRTLFNQLGGNTQAVIKHINDYFKLRIEVIGLHIVDDE